MPWDSETLTVLPYHCLVSVLTLSASRKWLNNRKQPINTLILTLSLFALFSSTTTNMVVTFLGNTKFLFAAVYSPDSTSQFICSSCAPTAALTINVRILFVEVLLKYSC